MHYNKRNSSDFYTLILNVQVIKDMTIIEIYLILETIKMNKLGFWIFKFRVLIQNLEHLTI